jgi:hypothetical protein
MAYFALPEPLLTVVRFLLAECEVNQFSITVLSLRKRNHVLLHMIEVVHGIRILARPETL